MAGFTIIVEEEKSFAPGAGGWMSPWRSDVADQHLDVASDTTQSIGIYELVKSNVENSAYEMLVPRLTLLIRQLDGEYWASWQDEHASADTADAASLELWTQLGHYLDSLEADEDSLSPNLNANLAELRSIMRRR